MRVRFSQLGRHFRMIRISPRHEQHRNRAVRPNNGYILLGILHELRGQSRVNRALTAIDQDRSLVLLLRRVENNLIVVIENVVADGIRPKIRLDIMPVQP